MTDGRPVRENGFIAGAGVRLRVAAVLAAALACLTTVSARAAVPTPAQGEISGMNAYSLSELPPSQWNLQLAAMRANGVQSVRSDADWGTIEPDAPGPSGPSWQFAYYDTWVSALASNHLTWEPILDYDNSWAMAVRNNPAFAAFGQAVAARYGVNGSFWAQHPQVPYMPVTIIELWNEENAQPWFINPQAYGPLYAATHAAIHAVDPHVSLDVGGLSDDSDNYVTNDDYPSWYVVRLLGYDPALEGQIDGFALHPYGTTATDVIEWVADFRRVLNYYHENSAPIDITEIGWTTGDSSQETWRAQQMRALGLAFRSSSMGLREIAPYDWINPTVLHDAGDFGFVDGSNTDAVLRPAAVAWFQAFTSNPAVTPTPVTTPAMPRTCGGLVSDRQLRLTHRRRARHPGRSRRRRLRRSSNRC
jgi:polysaccharide biosynthesis protein PslG